MGKVMAEIVKRADEAVVTPARVLTGQAHDQLLKLRRKRWSARRFEWSWTRIYRVLGGGDGA
jgi:hypothetical protein